jgi:hypothetical protein
LGRHAGFRLDHEVRDGFDRLLGASAHFAVAQEDATFVEANLAAFLDGAEDFRAHAVDERYPRGHNDFRAQVGKTAGDTRGRVHDAGHLRLDQGVRRTAVQVYLIEYNDVPGADSAQESARAPVDPGDADDPGTGLIRSR